MADVLLVTLPTIPGARIVRTAGLVHSSNRRPDQAVEDLQKQAQRMGANAVVDVRWVPSQYHTPGHVYGTAVVIEGESR